MPYFQKHAPSRYRKLFYEIWRDNNRYKEGKGKYYSVIKKLQRENKINEEFMVMLNSITLEDLISIRLELAAKAMKGKFFNFPILSVFKHVCVDAALKFAYSAARSPGEAAAFLGISIRKFVFLCKSYRIFSYFSPLAKEYKEKKNLFTKRTPNEKNNLFNSTSNNVEKEG